MKFPSISERYDLEFPSKLYSDKKLLLRLLEGKGIKRVLDLACGTGRIVDVINQQSIEYLLADNNLEMLKKAKAKYPENNITTLNVDLNKDITLPENIDFVSLIGSSVGLLESSKRLRSMAVDIFNSLNTNGMFLITQRKIEHHVGNGVGKFSNLKEYELVGFGKYSRKYRIVVEGSNYHFETYYYINSEEVHRDVFQMKIFDPNQIKETMEEVFGSDNVRVYGDLEFGEYTEHSSHLVVVCEKQ